MLGSEDVFAMRMLYSGIYLATHEMRMKEVDDGLFWQ
jgi:hypothetical protein